MNILKRNFFITLWQEKKLLLMAIAGSLVIALGAYSCTQAKRSWNWKIGGYESRSQVLIDKNICKLGKANAFRQGFSWEKYCD